MLSLCTVIQRVMRVTPGQLPQGYCERKTQNLERAASNILFVWLLFYACMQGTNARKVVRSGRNL